MTAGGWSVQAGAKQSPLPLRAEVQAAGMNEPEHLTITLTLPRTFTFAAHRWAQLGETLGYVSAESALTYLISQEARSLLIQEVNPPDLDGALLAGMLITRSDMGYDLTSHAAHGVRSRDHMAFALLMHAAADGKLKVSANVRAPDRWAAAETLIAPWASAARPACKVGPLKVRA